MAHHNRIGPTGRFPVLRRAGYIPEHAATATFKSTAREFRALASCRLVRCIRDGETRVYNRVDLLCVRAITTPTAYGDPLLAMEAP